ncbi:MAG: phosphatase PAP2 family protein [Allosphingosinicella sp.]
MGFELRGREEALWLVPLTVAVLLLYALAAIAGAPYGISTGAVIDDYAFKALRALPMLGETVILFLLARAMLSRSPHPIQMVIAPLRERFGSPMIAAAALAPLVLMPMLFTGFGVFKMLIPVHAPFAWDDSFAAADRLIFLGRQPWTLTHAVFGVEATIVLDRIYTAWVMFLSFAITGFALFAPRYDRARFFLAFTAAWLILGIAGAYLGSSAGPCYTGLIGASSAPDFAPLLARLNAYEAMPGVDLGAVGWQQVLWDAHVNRHYGFGMGISAMPSLHNAISMLYALAFFRFGRAAGIGASIFAFVIFLGSIHLGWHYAVDGIIAATAMVGLWWAAGFYLERSGYAAAVARDRDLEPAALPEPALA